MSRKAWFAVSVLAFGAALASSAAGAGPWPGLAQGISGPNGVVYAAKQQSQQTSVTATQGSRVLGTRHLRGAFGVPAVTLNGDAGGLSVDVGLLVLAEPPNYQILRRRSRFIVLRTPSLELVRTVVLNGDFGYDALSPDGRTLYLLQHRGLQTPEYAVRAYDLRSGRLLSRIIVDKRTPDEKMNGYPVARTSSAAGEWVYTL